MTSFDVYLLLVAIPSLGFVFVFTGLFIMLVSIMHVSNNDSKYITTGETISLCCSLIIILSAFFVPNRTEMATIYLAPKIMNNQVVQQIPAEIMKFIDKQIESEDK